jgi:hypothetical protein
MKAASRALSPNARNLAFAVTVLLSPIRYQ